MGFVFLFVVVTYVRRFDGLLFFASFLIRIPVFFSPSFVVFVVPPVVVVVIAAVRGS